MAEREGEKERSTYCDDLTLEQAEEWDKTQMGSDDELIFPNRVHLEDDWGDHAPFKYYGFTL